jgi:hypothetical protein
LPDRPDSGKGEPVLAIADGTVLDADWGSSGWSNYGQRVYMIHDGGDGHTYTSMVAHLHTIDVSAGQSVRAGDQLGTLGQSCEGELSCPSFSTPMSTWPCTGTATLADRAVVAAMADGRSFQSPSMVTPAWRAMT